MDNTSINPTTVRFAPVQKQRIENAVKRGCAKNVSDFVCMAVENYLGVCESR